MQRSPPDANCSSSSSSSSSSKKSTAAAAAAAASMQASKQAAAAAAASSSSSSSMMTSSSSSISNIRNIRAAALLDFSSYFKGVRLHTNFAFLSEDDGGGGVKSTAAQEARASAPPGQRWASGASHLQGIYWAARKLKSSLLEKKCYKQYLLFPALSKGTLSASTLEAAARCACAV
jgi:hypothetical protein